MIPSYSKNRAYFFFFMLYVFVAIFILLAMFLAILAEAQGAVRDDQEDAKRNRQGFDRSSTTHWRSQAQQFLHLFPSCSSGSRVCPAAHGTTSAVR